MMAFFDVFKDIFCIIFVGYTSIKCWQLFDISFSTSVVPISYNNMR